MKTPVTRRSLCYSAVSALLMNPLPNCSNYSPLCHTHYLTPDQYFTSLFGPDPLPSRELQTNTLKFNAAEKYKLLFDSFQSCFKDEHRYFAALYFIYRFLILLIGMLHKKLRTFYIILEVTLLVMFTIHACIGPYKNKWHNLIDTLLFSLLLLLNTITLLNFQQKSSRQDDIDYVKYTITLQIILAWLPLIVMMVYLVTLGASKLKSRLWSKKVKDDNSLELLSSTSLLEVVEERQERSEVKYAKHSTE